MARWHRWTEAEVDIIRRDYAHTKASKRELALRLRVTPAAVGGQIARLGIAKRDDRRPWTDAEKERLRELLPCYSIAKVAQMMQRSIHSVTVMAKRLGVSRRVRNGWYVKREVCEMLGVDHKWVQRRIDSGALKATFHNGRRPCQRGMSMWHIEEEDLRAFFRHYPEELNARNLNLPLVIDILVGII